MNVVPPAAFATVAGIMAIELAVSRRNERRMRAEGAFEPAGDVYRWLRVVYPACFVAMAAEGMLHAATPRPVLAGGLLLFAAAKALKTWAIVSLGASWSFHVLVRRAHLLVTRGPYRYLRHPNYVAIAGEIAGMAMIVSSPITGAASLLVMAELLRRRINIEERALGLRRLGS